VDIVTLGAFALGLALLIAGAEMLVRGGAGIATAIGVSPLVTGLTIVAFATSSPELAVCVQSALSGQADIAVGNVVGSNIFNILCVLGLSALIAPLAVSRQLVRLDVPVMVGVSGLLLVLALDGSISRPDGALLSAGLVAYTVWLIRQGRKESKGAGTDQPRGPAIAKARARWVIATDLALIAIGLAALVVGSSWLVSGAVAFARALGVSELIVGLTIIAAGTSLPELATSVVASVRGERDIAIGNAVGSSTFNILSVLGLSSLVAPAGIGVSGVALRFDIPVMIAVAAACLPVFFRGHVIARWEGALLFGYYLAYLAYLVLNAAQHEALPTFSAVMGAFVIPITAVTLLVLAVRYARDGRRLSWSAGVASTSADEQY